MANKKQRALDDNEHAKLKELLESAESTLKAGSVAPATVEFCESLVDESDRGCILVGLAYIDRALTSLLKSQFIDGEEKLVESLFNGNNALFQSCWSKTAMCYCLGLIDKNVRSGVDLIRKLRNRLAHNPDKVSLSRGDLLPLIETLPPHQQVITDSFWETFDELASSDDPSASQSLNANRTAFAMVVCFLLNQIEDEDRAQRVTITFTPTIHTSESAEE